MKNNNEFEKYCNAGTPSYFFDFDIFRERCLEIKNIVGKDIDLCFSMKANPFMIKDIPSCFSRIEVCSHGEFKICLRHKINPKIIFYSGVNKKYNEVEEAIKYGVVNFTIESYKHLKIIDELSLILGKKLSVFLRISADTQFGMDEKEIEKIVVERDNYPNLEFKGIHYFTGTQKKKSENINDELNYLSRFLIYIEKLYSYKFNEIEYGTGLYVEYFGDAENGYSELFEIKDTLHELSKISKVTIEMGRYFAATSGIYATQIDDVKCNSEKGYLIVDGGLNQLVYDGQLKGMRKPLVRHIVTSNNREETCEIHLWTVCGSLCTTNDVIVRDLEISNPKIGDILLFENVGAYSFMEGMSVFLSREMPRIYGVKDGKITLLRDYIYTHEFHQGTGCVC